MLPATQVILEHEMKQAEVRSEIMRLQAHIRFLTKELEQGRTTTHDRKIFVRKCPYSECRGFLSTQWKCNLCGNRTCKDCNECILMADEEHKCDPANIETAKLLAKDSKPCPNCGELIFKIDGCDQIFCTMCHTAFSWRTGRRETGAIHNPHYYEWMRKTNQTIDQDMVVRCGREVDHYFIRHLRSKGVGGSLFPTLGRNLIHFREVILPRYTTRAFEDNQDLRLLYLRNQISEEAFQSVLQKREKAREKKQDYYRLFAMMIQCVTDIMYRMSEEGDRSNPERETVYYSEVIALVEYVNGCLRDIANVYSSKRYMMDEMLHFREFRAS